MEQHIPCAIDSPLLQRVSKVREHMGLGALPTEISVSELDPLLLCLLSKGDGSDSSPDLTVVLEEQLRYCLQWDEKWNQWDEWNRWNSNGS